jgi:hypothetical protein
MKALLRVSLMVILAGGLFAGLATAAPILGATPFPNCPKPQMPAPSAGLR